MALGKIRLDFGATGSIVFGAASAGAVLPANTELLGLTTTNACHFRIGNGAQTAVQGDPALGVGGEMIILKLNLSNLPDTNIAAISDTASGGAAGTLTFYRVFEE